MVPMVPIKMVYPSGYGPTRPRPIFNYYRLLQRHRHLVGDQARNDIRRASRSQRYDQMHRFVGKTRRMSGTSQHCSSQNESMYDSHVPSPFVDIVILASEWIFLP
jgi:hypothetical protein